jgi:PTH1 family peptidyl-tRNA hydrolase
MGERHLIVGLGNPGADYAQTRHNIGFMAVERLASRHGISVTTKKFKGVVGNGEIAGQQVSLLMPQTFMNLSGESVQPAAAFYGINVSKILVLHDELDLAPGVLRVKQAGGHAGHNGLRDMIAKLGSPDFVRVRLGIGRPLKGEVTSHVLGRFSKQEEAWLDDLLERACDAVEVWLTEGVAAAQNKYNTGA